MTRRRAIALATAALALSRPARAFDPFEIQVYDGTADPARTFGLELHWNRFAAGPAQAEPPELPLGGQLHATLEPSFGLFDWWEIGGYFQTAQSTTAPAAALAARGGSAVATFEFGGVKLRTKFVTPPALLRNWRFGLNLELSDLPARFDRDRYGSELRPIAAFDDRRWLVVLNPIVDVPLGAPGRSDGPTFDPAVKITRSAFDTFAFGAEYYADVGPIARPQPLAQQGHRLLGVVDLVCCRNVEVDIGLGGGLTPASRGWLGKVILGYVFGSRR